MTSSQQSPSAPRSDDRPQGKRVIPHERRSFLAHLTLLSAATIGVFLAGGPVQGSLGIVLAIAGAALVVFPPKAAVNWRIWLAVGALLLCCSFAFLPAAWFSEPIWRHTLARAPSFKLPWTVTPVPWETGFWLAVFAFTGILGLFALSHPLRSSQLIVLAAGGAAVCALYAILAVYSKLSGWQYVFDGGSTFGFFPNRNHTATLLITGVLLSLGVLAIAFQGKYWFSGWVATASCAVCAGTLILFSESRGGVVFAIIGVVLFAAGLGRAHLDRRRLVFLSVFLTLSVLVLVVSGSAVRGRLASTVETSKEGSVAAREGRFAIFDDSTRMLCDFPLTGSGLGTFPLLFAQYQDKTLSDFTSIHPESDWLMLADEAGIPAVICALILVGMLLRRGSADRGHPYWPLRLGCMAAATAALLHGIVDVPVHRVVLGWWIAVIAGLGLQPGRAAKQLRGYWPRALFTASGIGAIVLGVLLVRGEWFGGAPLPPFVGSIATERAFRLYQEGKFGDGYEVASDAYEVSPLTPSLYFQAGASLMAYPNYEAEVDRLFETQQLLSPNWPEVPKQQAEAWSRADGARAAAKWSQSLDRRLRVDAAHGLGQKPTVALYTAILGETMKFPAIQTLLMREGDRGPEFALAAVEYAAPAIAGVEMERLAHDSKFMSNLSPAQQVRFGEIAKRRDLTRATKQ